MSEKTREIRIVVNVNWTLPEVLDKIEEKLVLSALASEEGNQTRAARKLGVSETRIRYVMKKFGIVSTNRRGRPKRPDSGSAVPPGERQPQG